MLAEKHNRSSAKKHNRRSEKPNRNSHILKPLIFDSSTGNFNYGSQEDELRHKLPSLAAPLLDAGNELRAASLSSLSCTRTPGGGLNRGWPLRFFFGFSVWVASVWVAELSAVGTSSVLCQGAGTSGSVQLSHKLNDR